MTDRAAPTVVLTVSVDGAAVAASQRRAYESRSTNRLCSGIIGETRTYRYAFGRLKFLSASGKFAQRGFGITGPHVEAELWTLVAQRRTRTHRIRHRLIPITKAHRPSGGSCGRQHGWRSDQDDAVIHPDRACRFDDGVDAGAG
jgi:hypothetical protein